MTCITISLLDKEDERLKKRLEDNKLLQDFFLEPKFIPGKPGIGLLLATTEKRTPFEGVNPLQMDIQERASEDLIAVISETDTDYTTAAYIAYADPFNTPSLYKDSRIIDGFIIKAGDNYDSPKDNHRLLMAVGEGAKITAVHRRSGEPAAAMDGRIFLARCGPYHPKMEEILTAFTQKPATAKGQKTNTMKLHVLSINVKAGKLTVDNTFKPKTIKWATAAGKTQSPQ